MNISFTETARRQIREITMFYAREHRSFGVAFIEALDRSLRLLVENPQLGHRVGARHRKLSLRRFPYMLIYSVDDENDRIQLSVVCHQRRRPGYWRSRVEERKPSYAIAA